jgi:hypothetical protein
MNFAPRWPCSPPAAHRHRAPPAGVLVVTASILQFDSTAAGQLWSLSRGASSMAALSGSHYAINILAADQKLAGVLPARRDR